MARTIITVAPAARRGEVIEVHTLIAHAMETGHRADSEGRRVPRDTLRRLVCRYDGAVIFEAELHAAIAANPLVSFHTVATVSGRMEFTWEGDNGFVQTASVAIQVA